MLLGDSGYPCSKYLMTPYPSPANNCQENFNRALCRTRVLKEQTFGIMKRRFNSLHDGYTSSVCEICNILCYFTWYWYRCINRIDVIVNNNIEGIAIEDCRGNININPTFDGAAKRNDIARQFFEKKIAICIHCGRVPITQSPL